MKTDEAIGLFDVGVKALMAELVSLGRSRDNFGEVLATLSRPENRQKIIDGDKKAIAMLFAYIDDHAERFQKEVGSEVAS